jgi:hypothetical protein
MAFWDGTRWIAEETAPSAPIAKSPRSNWATMAVMAVSIVALVVPLATASAGSRKHSDPPCEISASSVAVGETYWVSASGLPTGLAINLWITDSTGTTGSPLGSTTDGTFHMQESSKVAGTTTYAFSGPTKVHSTFVYSTCSVEAS